MLRIFAGALAALIIAGSAQAEPAKLPFPFSLFQPHDDVPVVEEEPRVRVAPVRPRITQPAPKECAEPNPADYENDTIIISTCRLVLYHIGKDGTRYTYRVGGGRDGFRWSGRGYVGRVAEWPDWYPPAAMLARDARLRKVVQKMPNGTLGMPGDFSNPLGARALYIYNEKGQPTEYRIHGTNNPDSIGKWMSSGCIRLINRDVMVLYEKVGVGTKVVVLN